MLDSVPVDWTACVLSDVIERIYGGGTPDKSKPEYWNGEIFWASVKDMATFDPMSTQDTITEEGLQNSSSKLVPAGTLVLCTRMAVGVARVFSTDVAINQDLKAIVPNSNASRDFLYYWFDSKQEYLESIATGTTVKGLRQNLLVGAPIALPPLPEQERIAEVLTSVDDRIRATEAVIAQAERVKRGLMEDLLTGDLGSEAIARGEVPEGWTARYAREIAIAKGLQTGPFGSQLKAAEYNDSDSDELTCVVMPKDIVDGRINFDTCARITDAKVETLSKHTLRTGDVLFARRGDLSKVAVYDEPTRRAICGTGCLRLRPDLDRTTYRFLRLVFTSHDAIQWLIANAVGATMLNLNTKIIGKLPLLIPGVEEQERIAGVIESLENQVQENRKTMAQLQTVKRGLMDDLLTGRVRTG